MSYLGSELKKIIKEAGLTQREVADAAKIYGAQLSRIITGQQLFVSHKDLEAIVGAFQNLPEPHKSKITIWQASLIAAHCCDERVGPGSEFVKISIEIPFGATPARRVGLSAEAERALLFIREKMQANPAHEGIIISLAELMKN